MVSYQTFTSIAYDVASGKGVTFQGISDGASFQKQIAAYWNQNKAELIQMTESQARARLQEVVSS